MDSNNLNNPPVMNTPSVPPAQPNVPQPTVQTSPPSQPKSNKVFLMVGVITVVVALAVIGGAFYYRSMQSQTNSKQAAAPAQAPDTLTQEASAVDLGSVDNSFTDVDQDVNNL